MFQHEHLKLILKLIEKQNVKQMNKFLYDNRCRCGKELTLTKKSKLKNRSEGKPFQYPKSNEIIAKTFRIEYQKKLSATAKLVLNSFHNKYIYYAIDDILGLTYFDRVERENLLSLLYSIIISLQNNFSVNFFDIWIRDIYINELPKSNKFLKKGLEISQDFNYITITLFCKTRTFIKKPKSLW